MRKWKTNSTQFRACSASGSNCSKKTQRCASAWRASQTTLKRLIACLTPSAIMCRWKDARRALRGSFCSIETSCASSYRRNWPRLESLSVRAIWRSFFARRKERLRQIGACSQTLPGARPSAFATCGISELSSRYPSAGRIYGRLNKWIRLRCRNWQNAPLWKSKICAFWSSRLFCPLLLDGASQ